MPNLVATRQTLIEEVKWMEEVVSDLQTARLRRTLWDKEIPLPLSLQSYEETGNRLKYLISLIATSIRDHRERSSRGIIEGSEGLILQELLLQATPSERTSLHVISSLVEICINCLEENATHARQCYATLKNQHFTNDKLNPREVLGSYAARSSPTALKTPFRLLDRKCLPRPITVALGLTSVLLESVLFLKDAMTLVSDIKCDTDIFYNDVPMKSFIGSIMFRAGAYEILSDVLILESATVLGNAAKKTSPNDDDVNCEIVVGDNKIGQDIRSAAAQTIFLIVQVCGVESEMLAGVMALLFPKQFPRDFVQATRVRCLVSRYVLQYDVTLESNSFVKRSIIAVLSVLMTEDPLFFLSIFPGDGRSANNQRISSASGDSLIRLKDAVDSYWVDRDSPTQMITFPRLLMQILQEPISYSEKHKTEDDDECFMADVETKALAASVMAGLLLATGQSGNTGVIMRITLWGLVMSDIEGVGKVLLLNLHYAHKIYSVCSSIDDTCAEYNIVARDKSVVIITDLIDALLSFLIQSIEFYSRFSSEQERNHQCAQQFYQYSHRVKLIEQATICLRRNPRYYSPSYTSGNIEGFFLLSSLRVVAKAARVIRYYCERCPPLVGLLPCSLIGCDSTLEILLCSIEPIAEIGPDDDCETLCELSSVTPSSKKEDQSISDINNNEKNNNNITPSPCAYFETIQSEIATSLAVTLLRSPCNRNLFRYNIMNTFVSTCDVLPLSLHTRELITNEHPDAVIRVVSGWIHDAIANGLDGDDTHPSFVRGMLIQDDSGRCINDPFNFSEGWNTDETLALELGSVLNSKSSKSSFYSLRFPNVDSCMMKGVNFEVFERYFLPTQTALDAVLDAQEYRLTGVEPCNTPVTTSEELHWRSASFWANIIEPLRRECSSNTVDYRAVKPIRLAAKIYGHLALALFKHVLKRISQTPYNKERRDISRQMNNYSHVMKTYNPKSSDGVTSSKHDGQTPLRVSNQQPSLTINDGYNHGLNRTLKDTPLSDKRVSDKKVSDKVISSLYNMQRKRDLMAQKEARDLLQAEFDAAFKLAVELSEHYKTKVAKAAQRERRKLTPFSPDYTRSNSRYIDVNQKVSLRAWTVNAVQDGDLFYLDLPLESLTADILEAVLNCARKHYSETKKAFITTSAQYRERRWFLQDLYTNVMPRIITLLHSLHKICLVQGDRRVQASIAILPCIKTPTDQSPKLTVSNLIPVVQFLSQYFNREPSTGMNSSEGRVASEESKWSSYRDN